MAKNNFIIPVFALSLSAAAFLSSSNDVIASSDNLQNINSVILSEIELSVDYDINKDKAIDIFDVAALRKDINDKYNDTGIVATSDYSATADNVKLIGRNYINDGTTWLTQSGSAVEFSVTGTKAEITIVGDSSVNSDEKYRPRYAVIVNDEVIKDVIMGESEQTVEILSSDSNQTANVKVILLSEGAMGCVGVSNISITSDKTNPIKPLPKKNLKIEFIGDSITCAYGVEADSNYDPFTTSTENFMKSYAYLTADILDVDYSAVCYSGHGIISGYSTGEKVTESLMPDYYGLINKNSNYAYDWDFENNANDVVVINLGTNDSSYLSYGFEERSPEFITEYEKFLYDVRKKNPDAYIICTVGTMGGTEVYDLIAEAVSNYTTTSGDKKVSHYLSTVQNQADGYGADWHPSEVTQQNSAYVLADKICNVLGIESSQIGLNMTENSEYELVINNPDAYAASYVGYDKSFWINTTNGGEDITDIIAEISEIQLKKDGRYRLEFDYTSSTAGVSIPFEIKGINNSYYNEKLITSSEKQHFSDTFTVFENDTADLLFYIGCNDSFNLTLSNIKLIKIG